MKELVKKVMKEEGFVQEEQIKKEYQEFMKKAYEDIVSALVVYNKGFGDFLDDLRKLDKQVEAEFNK